LLILLFYNTISISSEKRSTMSNYSESMDRSSRKRNSRMEDPSDLLELAKDSERNLASVGHRPSGNINYVYHAKDYSQTTIVGKGTNKISSERYENDFSSFLSDIKKNNFSFFKKYFNRPGYDIIQVQEISNNEIVISIYEIVKRKNVFCEFNSQCKSEIFLMTLNKNCDIKNYIEYYPAYLLNLKKTYKPQSFMRNINQEVDISIEETKLQEEIERMLSELPSNMRFLLQTLDISILRNIMSYIEQLHEIQMKKEKLGKPITSNFKLYNLVDQSCVTPNKKISLFPPPGFESVYSDSFDIIEPFGKISDWMTPDKNLPPILLSDYTSINIRSAEVSFLLDTNTNTVLDKSDNLDEEYKTGFRKRSFDCFEDHFYTHLLCSTDLEGDL